MLAIADERPARTRPRRHTTGHDRHLASLPAGRPRAVAIPVIDYRSPNSEMRRLAKRDGFDLLAPIYDRLFSPPRHSPLSDLLALPTAGALLDAGGGTGRHAQGWVGQAHRIIVADASRPMLRRARAKGGLCAVACLAECLPFATQVIARVVMVDAFHHLIDQEASLAELWRVLRAGGRIVIEEPDIRRYAVRWVARLERWVGMRSRFLTAEAIAARLSQLGAAVNVQRQGHNAWVIADKPGSPPSAQSSLAA